MHYVKLGLFVLLYIFSSLLDQKNIFTDILKCNTIFKRSPANKELNPLQTIIDNIHKLDNIQYSVKQIYFLVLFFNKKCLSAELHTNARVIVINMLHMQH